ncbi:MAG TPA: carbohydrate ABC transporter permease, partial [Anaerolineales bacterium]|nr:carbohydrate ABC transporter permease [Anaerolineales bacterium]
PVGALSFENYRELFAFIPVGRFLFNSIFVTGVTVGAGLLVNSLAGFALARLRWKGRRFVMADILALIIIPFETVAVPLVLLVNNLPWLSLDGVTVGWFNSYRVQIVPFMANALAIFLFVQFFKELPKEFFDAARIDGASWLQVFRWIVVPLSGPVYSTAAILQLLAMWNQYLWPALVIQTDSYRPIMVGFGYVYGFSGVSMAYLVIATLPPLLLFILFQKNFLKSIGATHYSA